MNPIYTGKDVSYIDTKQANRAAENAVLEAERFAVFAGLLAGATYPAGGTGQGVGAAGLRRTPRRHHRLGVRPGVPRPADRLARRVGARPSRPRQRAGAAVERRRRLRSWCGTRWRTTEPTSSPMRLDEPFARRGRRRRRQRRCRRSSSTTATRSAGWRATCRRWAGGPTGSATGDSRRAGSRSTGNEIGNEHYRLRVDPARGGGVVVVDRRRPRTDRRRPRRQRTGGLRRVSGAPARRARGRGTCCPRGRWSPRRRPRRRRCSAYRSALGERIVVTRPHRRTAALHPDDDAVARRRPRRLPHHHRRIHRRRPAAAAALAVPGAGCDARQRGRRRGDRPRFRADCTTMGRRDAVDTASIPYTLDNPAYGWFGLSSAVRVRVGDRRVPCGVGGRGGVARRRRRPAARDLMVALVAGRRHRHLQQRRQAPLRRPHRRLEPARRADRHRRPGRERLHRSGSRQPRPDTEELDRQLDADGVARVWVPADAPLARRLGARRRPARRPGAAGADRRRPRRSRRGGRTGRRPRRRRDRRRPGRAGGDLDDFEARTVAVLNRGVPSFAVDPDGTLHTSLMRSCTGWPSGTWIDPPRRTAPDGSNFQLQHWTHTFDYAVVAGDGDWRDGGHARRAVRSSANRCSRVVAHRDAAPAGCRRGARCSRSSPPARSRSVRSRWRATRSPRGSAEHRRRGRRHRSASGRNPRPDNGRRDPLRSAQRRRARSASTCWSSRVARQATRLTPARLRDRHRAGRSSTCRASSTPTTCTLAPDAEAAQPLYARYWLHNRGPAPLGGLPAVAHLHPHQLRPTPARRCSCG